MNDELILDEAVAVVVKFDNSRGNLNRCLPIKFKRASGREVVITKVGLLFPRPSGAKMVHVFDVSDGQADYRLEFDAERLSWRLVREADCEG